MKKKIRNSILCCALFVMTGCTGLEMVATDVFGGLLLDNTTLKSEPQDNTDELWWVEDEKKTG
tara:strand:+ start:199 stop:387 length:189 start_codon:yes stop_codon:yes gene_type:complete